MKTLRFTVEDGERAFEEWGANCGPGAIAAIAGLTLDELRPHMGDFETKGYTNPTLMWAVLDRLGVDFLRIKPPQEWPEHGLARIQWEGPWTWPGVPRRARYRHTHWVATTSTNGALWVFDINAMQWGGWVPVDWWETELAPWIMRECEPEGNGRWSFADVAEVRPT